MFQPIIKLLKAIEAGGTEIISCSTCLNYFDRMEKVIVGRSGDMKDSVDALLNYRKVVTF